MIKVIALCMFTLTSTGSQELMEHLYVPEGIGKCLEMKRIAERNLNTETKMMMCGEVMAQMSDDGKHIVSIRKK